MCAGLFSGGLTDGIVYTKAWSIRRTPDQRCVVADGAERALSPQPEADDTYVCYRQPIMYELLREWLLTEFQTEPHFTPRAFLPSLDVVLYNNLGKGLFSSCFGPRAESV